MNNDFEIAASIKFDKGANEHNQPWNLKHIDHLKEIQDELCDLHNYATLDPDDPMMKYILAVTKSLWEKVDYRRKNGK